MTALAWRVPMALGCAGVLAVLTAGLSGPAARAAPATVEIFDEEFAPASVTVFVSERVTWVNRTDEPITFTVTGSDPQVLAQDEQTSRTFATAGTYRAVANRLVGNDPEGTVVVRARPPSATASPRPSASRPGTSPTPQPKPSSGPSAEPTPAPTVGSSRAPGPIIPSGPPPTRPAATAEPTPQVAAPADPPVTGPGQPADRRALVQGVPARAYGLPAAVAAVVILGLGAALVRVLLAEPAPEGATRGW